jgi:hypothetical protein
MTKKEHKRKKYGLLPPKIAASDIASWVMYWKYPLRSSQADKDIHKGSEALSEQLITGCGDAFN